MRYTDKICAGDRVQFAPKNPRRHDAQEGVVVDEVNDGDGYNVLCPLDGDPGRIIRLWRRDGDFVVVERHVAEEKVAKEVASPQVVSPALTCDDIRTYSVEDVVRRYRGMSAHQAWDRYVIDTGLQPQFDLKDLVRAWR